MMSKCPTMKAVLINPIRATFFTVNKNIYFHFMSFPHIDVKEVVEIPPLSKTRTKLFYIVNVMDADVLATKEPGHQHP